MRIPEPNANVIKLCSPFAPHNVVGAAPLPTTCADDHVSVLSPVGVSLGDGTSFSAVVEHVGVVSALPSAGDDGVSARGDAVASLSCVASSRGDGAVVLPASPAAAINANDDDDEGDDDDDDDDEELGMYLLWFCFFSSINV